MKGGATVAAVAIESGFGHASRFAEQYRRLFGHNPSDVTRTGYAALEVA